MCEPNIARSCSLSLSVNESQRRAGQLSEVHLPLLFNSISGVVCWVMCRTHATLSHSSRPWVDRPTAAEKVPWRWEARGSVFFYYIWCSLCGVPTNLSLILSVCLSLSLTLFSLTGSFFLHTWIPVGVCNSKHLLGKMLVAAPSPHGLTGPIPLALRPEEYGHMTSNILIWGLGCILSNRKLFFVLFCFSPLPNQQKYFTFRHLRHFHYCRLFYGGPMAEI